MGSKVIHRQGQVHGEGRGGATHDSLPPIMRSGTPNFGISIYTPGSAPNDAVFLRCRFPWGNVHWSSGGWHIHGKHVDPHLNFALKTNTKPSVNREMHKQKKKSRKRSR